MDAPPLHIYLAEDSDDDQLLFKEALHEIPLPTVFTAFEDGEQLMRQLNQKIVKLPDVIFLDLNMPRKNGYECLAEIKMNYEINSIPVVILSTSYNRKMIKRLYNDGAQHYIRKPNDFETLVKQIHEALTFALNSGHIQPSPEAFVLDV